MKDRRINKSSSGFSIVELLLAMTIMLVVLGLAASLFSASLNKRHRESSRTDALTSAQAALNVISREIANSGYGLTNNGIVITDSNNQKLHFLSNVKNTNGVTTDSGEDITFFFDPVTESILRYDAHGNGLNVPATSIIINRISSVNFQYFDYSGSVSTLPPPANIATLDTARVRVTVSVKLEDVPGEVANQSVVLRSDVALRNSNYMLRQY